MTESTAASSAVGRPRRRLWRWLIALVLLIVIGIAGVAGYFWYQNYQLDRTLESLIAELDKTDPGWRLEEIDAAHPPLPDEENAALQVIAAREKVPDEWFDKATKLSFRFYFIAPNAQLADWQTQEFENIAKDPKAALEMARKLRDYPKGRYRIDWTENWLSTEYEEPHAANGLAFLLEYDVMLLVQQGKINEAWQSCESLYRVGTSIGNAEGLLLALSRSNIRNTALNCMQRVLAQGTVDSEALLQVEKMLREDVEVPLLWMAMRGYRAGGHRAFLAHEQERAELELPSHWQQKKWPEWLQTPIDNLRVKSGHIYFLRWMKKAIHASKLPPYEALQRFDELTNQFEIDRKNETMSKYAELMTPAGGRTPDRICGNFAHIHSAIIALASERFRLKHKRWPKDLEELLAKKYISKVPNDPFDGKPLRFKQNENGIAVYSTGYGESAGYKGQLLDDPKYEPAPLPIGFHVWNPDKRRLPPRPPNKREHKFADYTDVWIAGKDGYHTYRIPAIIVTKKGTLLAFCEGRKNNSRDHGDIDLLVKRSTDNGKSWSKHKIVYEEGGDKKITIGNPCPVVDQTTGIVWLPFTRNNDEVLVTHSKDDGKTWAEPTNITASVKEKNWTSYATGPGVGIQMQTKKYKGRLVIPCDHQIGKPGVDGGATYSHVIYSDDSGKTWKLGGTVAKHTDECQVVELHTGELYINMRNYWGRHGNDPSKDSMRAVALSKDGGETWGELRFDKTLIEPVCQASVIRDSFWRRSTILFFSNPASKKHRRNLLFRRSEEAGKTWPEYGIIHHGPAAYSCLVSLPDGSVGCLYEGGRNSPYEKIRFAHLGVSFLDFR